MPGLRGRIIGFAGIRIDNEGLICDGMREFKRPCSPLLADAVKAQRINVVKCRKVSDGISYGRAVSGVLGVCQ